MHIRNMILAAGLAMGLANLGGAAFAQKIAVVDEDAVFEGSKIGGLLAKTVNDFRVGVADKLELKKLQDELKTEEAAIPQLKTMTPEALSNAAKTDVALKTKLESFAKKQGDLQVRANQFNGATNQQAGAVQNAFGFVLAKAVESVAKADAVDIVVPAGSVMYVNKAKVDISQKVIARLDATVATLAALEAALPKQPAAPAAGAAAVPGAPAPGVAPAPVPVAPPAVPKN